MSFVTRALSALPFVKAHQAQGSANPTGPDSYSLGRSTLPVMAMTMLPLIAQAAPADAPSMLPTHLSHLTIMTGLLTTIMSASQLGNLEERDDAGIRMLISIETGAVGLHAFALSLLPHATGNFTSLILATVLGFLPQAYLHYYSDRSILTTNQPTEKPQKDDSPSA